MLDFKLTFSGGFIWRTAEAYSLLETKNWLKFHHAELKPAN